MMAEARRLVMPRHHDVRIKDVDLKRLGTVLAVAQESELRDFESLLLLKGLGPRTLQNLVMVSEVIHGTPSRFNDPARFSFSHGGKDGHPFPVPTKVYDETIEFLKNSLDRAHIERSEKQKAMQSLHKVSKRWEQHFTPDPNRFEPYVEQERRDSWKYGGKTVFGDAEPPKDPDSGQLSLF